MMSLQRLIDPATSGRFAGRPSGLGHMRAWFRMRDGQQPSSIMLLQVIDALRPVAYDLGVSGGVPTLQRTVHMRAEPAAGWLRMSTSSVNFASGFLEEGRAVLDASDRLVAQAGQTGEGGRPASRGWVVCVAHRPWITAR